MYHRHKMIRLGLLWSILPCPLLDNIGLLTFRIFRTFFSGTTHCLDLVGLDSFYRKTAYRDTTLGKSKVTKRHVTDY